MNYCRYLAVIVVASLFFPLSSHAQKLKKVHIMATGGTIAGSAASETQTVGYKASTIPADVLVAAVPAVNKAAKISAEQFAQVASENMTPDTWLALAKRVNTVLAAPDIDGIVITHGTDTLEETAYFLHLTVKSEKPVVVVGAMRPATALSADGPLNLYNAVLVAASDSAKGKGVMVVMDDIIVSGRDVKKASTYRTSALASGEYGTIGTVVGGQVDFAYAPLKKHTTNSAFAVSDLKTLPNIAIIYSYAGSDEKPLAHALADGAKGIVIACTGNGSFNATIRDYMVAQKLNTPNALPVVRATRVVQGAVARNGEVNDDAMHTIPALSHSPQKARILLMLGLAANMTKQQLAEAFAQY